MTRGSACSQLGCDRQSDIPVLYVRGSLISPSDAWCPATRISLTEALSSAEDQGCGCILFAMADFNAAIPRCSSNLKSARLPCGQCRRARLLAAPACFRNRTLGASISHVGSGGHHSRPRSWPLHYALGSSEQQAALASEGTAAGAAAPMGPCAFVGVAAQSAKLCADGAAYTFPDVRWQADAGPEEVGVVIITQGLVRLATLIYYQPSFRPLAPASNSLITCNHQEHEVRRSKGCGAYRYPASIWRHVTALLRDTMVLYRPQSCKCLGTT